MKPAPIILGGLLFAFALAVGAPGVRANWGDEMHMAGAVQVAVSRETRDAPLVQPPPVCGLRSLAEVGPTLLETKLTGELRVDG